MHTFYIEANIHFQTDIISDPRLQRSEHDSSNCARSSMQQDMLALGEFLIPENIVVVGNRKVNCSKSRGGEILLLLQLVKGHQGEPGPSIYEVVHILV